MKPKQESYGLRDILTIFFKHKYKILFASVPVIIVTIILALNAPIHYVARSVVMVKPGREFVPMTEVYIPEYKMPTIGFESMINTEIQLITSHDLTSRVIDAIGVYNIYPELKNAHLTGPTLRNVANFQFSQDLLVKAIKSSNALEVYFRHKKPFMAAKVTNTLVEFLKDKHLEVFGESRSPLIADQLKMYENRLRTSMDNLAAFKDKYQITSLKDQFWWIIGKRTDIENTVKLEESKLEELRKKLAFLKNQTRKIDPDLYTAIARQRLMELMQKETQLLGTYKEQSRPVTNIRNEIKTVRDELYRYEGEKKDSGEWVSVEADIGPQILRIANIKQQKENLDRQLNELSSKSEELNKLEREISMQQVNYEAYLKKYEEARISEEMDKKKITNIQVIEEAAVPVTPVKANQRKIFGVGLFAALSFGLGLALAFEYIPQGITTPESAKKRLHLPVLVVISYKK